jgi:hypothetical protein
VTLDELRRALTLVGQAIAPLESVLLPQGQVSRPGDVLGLLELEKVLRSDPAGCALLQAELSDLRRRLDNLGTRLLVAEAFTRIAGGAPPAE